MTSSKKKTKDNGKEQTGSTEEIKERHLKHIAEISKHLSDRSPPDGFNEPNEEEQNWLNSKMPNVQIKKKPKSDINNKDDDDDKPSEEIFVEASRAIMDKYKFLTIEETKEMLYYKNGVYVPGAEVLIEKEAQKMFDYQLVNRHLPEIKGQIMRRTYHKQEEVDADINIINLKNGLYDIDKNKLKKHTHKYLSVNQKSITCVKGAKPKLFGKFLSEVFYPT